MDDPISTCNCMMIVPLLRTITSRILAVTIAAEQNFLYWSCKRLTLVIKIDGKTHEQKLIKETYFVFKP